MTDRLKEDLLLGIFVIGIAFFLILYSTTLPIPGRWMDAPSTVPIGLSIVLIGLGMGLIFQARKKGGRLSGIKFGRNIFCLLKSQEFRRAFFSVLFVFLFISSLPYLQFYPASLLFIIIGIRIYSPLIKWYSIILVAFITVVSLFIIFSYIFKLPLGLGVFEYLLKLIIGRTYL